MLNPGKLLKLKQDKDRFVLRHQEFVRFLEKKLGAEISEGDEITLVYTKKDGSSESSSAKLTREDLELINTIGKLF